MCDRTVKLVLATWVWSLKEDCGRRKMRETRGSRGGQVNGYERVGVGIQM